MLRSKKFKRKPCSFSVSKTYRSQAALHRATIGDAAAQNKISDQAFANSNAALDLVGKPQLARKRDRIINELDWYTKLCSLRQKGMSINEYILQCKILHVQMKMNGVSPPKWLLIFQLLQGSNLSLEHQKLVLLLTNKLKMKTIFSLLKWMSKMSSPIAKYFPGLAKKEKDCQSLRRSGIENTTFVLEEKKQSDDLEVLSHRGHRLGPLTTPTESSESMESDSSEQVAQNDKGLAQVTAIHLTEDREKFDALIDEANGAVMNPQCLATVAGETWFENYTKKLSPLQQRAVKTSASTALFKLTGQSRTMALKSAVFPVKIGTHACTLQAEILDANIPLLLGKKCLQSASTVIDVENEKAQIFSNSIDLHTTFGGLYYFNLFPNRVCSEYMYKQENQNGAMDANVARACAQEKQIMQLHYDYGHASAGNLRRLVRSAGIMTTKLNTIIENVINECRKCNRKPTEVDDFNKRVFVGFHELEAVDKNEEKVWYMQIIDEHTGFSNGAIITTKEAAVRIFLKCWLCLFGAPTTVVTDTSTKFTGDDFDEMCRTFGINVSATPSSLSWSSGVCGRHHASLSATYSKIRADNQCDSETALLWAISAKNAVVNKDGVTPSQLVFGRTESGSDGGLNDKQSMFRASLRSSDLSTLRMARAALDEMRDKKNGNGRRYKSQFESLLEEDCVNEKKKEELGQVVEEGSENKVLVPFLFLRKGSEYVKAYVCRVQAAMDEKPCGNGIEVRGINN